MPRDRASERASRERAEVPPRQALQQRVASAILQAGARTFASRGDRANLADVAVAAGVARATVYRYFPNRRRLLDELSRITAEDVHARLMLARIDEVAVEEGLSRAVRTFVDAGDAFIVLVRERARRDDVAPAWLFESLVGLVAGALRHGSLGPDDTVACVTSVFLQGARAVRSRER
jgi:TetR/AcrR family transcriptional regulator, mexCD-oprJ operon repressor